MLIQIGRTGADRLRKVVAAAAYVVVEVEAAEKCVPVAAAHVERGHHTAAVRLSRDGRHDLARHRAGHLGRVCGADGGAGIAERE